MTLHRLGRIAAAIACLSGTHSQAATYTYTQSTVIGGIGQVAPSLSFNAGDSLEAQSSLNIGFGGTGWVAQQGGIALIDTLYLGYTPTYVGSTGVGEYRLNGGTLQAGTTLLGTNSGTPYRSAYGSFVQAGGTSTFSKSFYLGRDQNTRGSVLMTGGVMNSSFLLIGLGGQGLFEQTAGTHNATYLGLGVSGDTGQGTYKLSGGTLNVSQTLDIAHHGGFNGVGNAKVQTFEQSGGNLVARSISIASGSNGSIGALNITGNGSLSTSYLDMATYDQSVATVYQNGGHVSIAGDLVLTGNSASSGSSGTYTLRAGTLEVTRILRGSGDSQFDIEGGTFNLTGNTAAAKTFSVGLGHSASLILAAGKTITADTFALGALARVQMDGTLDAQAVTLASGAHLFGNGTVRGAVSGVGAQLGTDAGTSGLESPGTSRLTFSGPVTLSNSTFAMRVLSATDVSTMVFNDTVSLTGNTLKLYMNSSLRTAGSYFDLFDFNGGVTGQFTLDALPTLASGLAWDTSRLYTTGEIGVIATTVPEPGSLALMLAGLGLVGVRRRRVA